MSIDLDREKNSGKKIKNYIQDMGLIKQVYKLKYVENIELVALYRNAIALVMPTYLGPTNIPQLEAFALGCPVLTSNIYGIPEQVSDAAILFDPDNVNDIAEKIKLVWNDKSIRMNLIKKGYQKHAEWNQKHFNTTLSSILDKYISNNKEQ